MSVAMALGHQHHSIQQSDLEVLDALTMMPSAGAGARNGRPGSDLASFGVETAKRRPLDTLQALRRPPIDPIVLAATLSSGPHVTRHHFLHSFGPKVQSKQMTRSERAAEKKREEEAPASSASVKTRARAGSYANCDSEDRTTLQDVQDIIRSIEEENEQGHHSRPSQYPSKQAPRSERLRSEQAAREEAERKRQKQVEGAKPATPPQANDRPDLSRMPSAQLDQELAVRKQRIAEQQEQSHQKQLLRKQKSPLHPPTPAKGLQASPLEPVASSSSFSSIVRPPPLTVRCYARTRIPTPHGEIFCHLYRNNRDQKEHLALVVDPAQNAPNDEFVERPGKMIRSRTLDEVWGPTETEMERIVRGAYVGRLGPTFQEASQPQTQDHLSALSSSGDVEAPLVRIHSECYTGETIGSQRCDCGEQLDEAIRLIHSDARPAKGVVVYLRQEGRGIGLLDKLMAYNLQDMGHDTVAANILLGHLADARKYDIAAEILRDLGVDSCRLLTNNPEKMEALEAEGVRVAKRVPMVPRIWRLHSHAKSYRRRKQKQRKGKTHKRLPLDASIISQFDSEGGHGNSGPGSGVQTGVTTDNEDEYDEDDDADSDDSHDSYLNHVQRRSGATLIGGSVTRGPELEKYLRTKVERMGHLLELPKEDAAQEGANEALEHAALAKTESDADTAPLTDDEPLLNEQYLRTVASNDVREDAHSAHTGDEDGEEILVSKS